MQNDKYDVKWLNYNGIECEQILWGIEGILGWCNLVKEINSWIDKERWFLFIIKSYNNDGIFEFS